MDNKKPFVKWVLHGIELPLHQNLIYWYLRYCLPGFSPHLPQIKLNSQLSSCTSFLVHSDIWLLISGYHFTIFVAHSCHSALISGHLFRRFVSFGVWLLAGEVLIQFGFVGLVRATDLVQTAQANMGIAHSKAPHPAWETLGGKKLFFWLVSL